MTRSEPAHIAMVGVPAISHVLPSLEVIRELVRRGHRVSYANDPRMRELIEETGAELVPYRSQLPVDDDAWPADAIAAMEIFLDEAIQALPQIRPFYTENAPDIYLSDIAGYPARVLAENQRRPLLQLSPAMVAWEGYVEEVGAQLRTLPGAEAHEEKFRDWLTEQSATTTDPEVFRGVPPRSVVLILEAMQPHADRVDRDRYTFVGPAFGDRSDQGDWQRPPGADQVLLISLGSTYTNLPGFYRECLAAFGDLPGWHVVLQIGKHTEISELGEIPANVEVRRWVPQLSVLRQADAFVTHAGMGGCSEGLTCGVPMIAVPQDVDQPQNADTLAALGIARRIDTADATGPVLRQALLELTSDPAVARRLAELRTAAEAAGGARRAADLIESALGGD